jgi:hypothetical protein
LLEARNLISQHNVDTDQSAKDTLIHIKELNILLNKEKENTSKSTVKCSQLEELCETLRVSVSEKDDLLTSAEIYLRQIDNDRINESEKLQKDSSVLRDNYMEEIQLLKVRYM